MEFALVVYLVGLSGEIGMALAIPVMLSSVALIVLGMLFVISHDSILFGKEERAQRQATIRKYAKPVILVFASSIIASTLIPSKDTSEKMVAAYVAQQITEVEGAKELPKNVVDYINNQLKKGSQNN